MSVLSRKFNWDGGIQVDYVPQVLRELVRRHAVEELLSTFESQADISQLEASVRGLSLLRTPGVDSALRNAAVAGNGEEQQFFALKYFAEAGVNWALDTLSCHWRGYSVSSTDWADIARIVGRHRFFPAAANLIASLDAAYVGLGIAAQEALDALFPDAHAALLAPHEAEVFWTSYLEQHRPDLTKRAPC